MIGWLIEVTRRKFVRDTLTLQLTTIVQGGTYLLTSVLTARYLGPTDLGRWVTSREIYMFAYFLVSTGIVNATITRYSKAIGQKDRVQATLALAALIKITLVTSILLATVGAALGPLVGERFYEDRELGVFAAVLCASGLFEVVRSLVVTALQGSRQMARYASLDMSANILRVGLIWGALATGQGLLAVVVAFVVHMFLTAVIALVTYQKARRGDADLAPPALGDLIRAIPRAPVKHIFGISYLLALNKGLSTLTPRLAMLLIPALPLQNAMADNGVYSVAYVLSWSIALILAGISQSLLPAIGHRMGADNASFAEMGGALKRVSLVSGALMAALTLLSIPVMYLIVNYVYGEVYAGGFKYYLWLSVGNFFAGFFVIIDSFLIYSGKLKKMVPYYFLLAATSVAAMIFASEYYGPIGVAAAAGLARIFPVFMLLYIVWYFARNRGRGGDDSGSPVRGSSSDLA